MTAVVKMLRNFANGLAFGAVQTVPSISGGTIAIILGFYFDLIRAINRFRDDVAGNLKFLLPLFAGTAAGILLFSAFVGYFLENHSLPTMLFLLGLVLGIVPHILARVREGGGGPGLLNVILIAAPFPLLILPALLASNAPPDPGEVAAAVGIGRMLFIFFAGILAAAALVVPGISGSFLLLMLGIYPLVINSLRLLLAGDTAPAVRVLGPLALGILVGGLSMLRLIELLLEKRRRSVYSLILGLIPASAVAMMLTPMVYRSGVTPAALAVGTAAFAVGAALSFMLGRKRI